MLYAISSVIETNGLVAAETVDITEHTDLAEEYGALAVPMTYVGDIRTADGLQPEDEFIDAILGETGEHRHEIHVHDDERRDFDVVIIGAGPAGLTAAIYAKRSGMKSVILEKANVGGQVALTPVVENYPGFGSIGGKALVELMYKHAAEYAEIHQGTGVNDIKKTGQGFEIYTGRGLFTAKAIIIATGADYRKLGVPGEERLRGRGISFCATCDGYLFKDNKKTVVIGGGNTALTDALYLDSIGSKVTVIHRKDSFRAENRLQTSLAEKNIPVIWNAVVQEFDGDKVLKKIVIKNTKTDKTETVRADGAFIAVGHVPNNKVAKMLGLKLDAQGYIKADDRNRTSIHGVYAAGDVTGSEKQIVVATAHGSVAAISAFEDFASPYWIKEKKK